LRQTEKLELKFLFHTLSTSKTPFPDQYKSVYQKEFRQRPGSAGFGQLAKEFKLKSNPLDFGNFGL